MIIQPNTLKYYFLTCDTNGIRKNHMMKEFSGHDLTEVNPVLGIGKYKSVGIGFSRMIDAGLRNQVRDKPFQPFVLFEDDVAKYRNFPDSLVIPDNTDILYIGISKCGANRMSKWSYDLYMENVDDTVVRIYNMLSCHGVIVCSAAGAAALQKCMSEAYYTDTVCDIYTARIQPHYNVYALKRPLVYQKAEMDGVEHETRFELTGFPYIALPEHERIPILSAIMCRQVT